MVGIYLIHRLARHTFKAFIKYVIDLASRLIRTEGVGLTFVKLGGIL